MRVRPEHREHVVADEFLAQSSMKMFSADAEQLGLAPRRLQLLALAEIGVKVTTSQP
jgi:hypothetical protein